MGSAAENAWRSILELVGWGERFAPRFPMVADQLDLSPKQLGALWRLDPAGPGVPMRSMAELLFCDASYMTDVVDKLEQRGLIERRPDPNDRRVKLIALTPEGVELRERALGLLYEPPAGISSLSAAEQRTLAELLDRAASS